MLPDAPLGYLTAYDAEQAATWSEPSSCGRAFRRPTGCRRRHCELSTARTGNGRADAADASGRCSKLMRRRRNIRGGQAAAALAGRAGSCARARRSRSTAGSRHCRRSSQRRCAGATDREPELRRRSAARDGAAVPESLTYRQHRDAAVRGRLLEDDRGARRGHASQQEQRRLRPRRRSRSACCPTTSRHLDGARRLPARLLRRERSRQPR